MRSPLNTKVLDTLYTFDDILIYSIMEKKHLDMISNAFECLQKAGLKIKLSKCSFFKEQIHYLGHLVNENCILQLIDKEEVLMKCKPPTNIKEVRHFLGLTGYYRKFICNYLDIVYPLDCLTRKSQPFIWTPHCKSSFNMLCLLLGNMPIVLLPDPNTYCSQTQVNSVTQVSLHKHL